METRSKTHTKLGGYFSTLPYPIIVLVQINKNQFCHSELESPSIGYFLTPSCLVIILIEFSKTYFVHFEQEPLVREVFFDSTLPCYVRIPHWLGGERNTLYKGEETFPSQLRFKNLERKLERESLKWTISASGGLGPLQMVSELDTRQCVRQCASKDDGSWRGWISVGSHID